MPSKRGDMYWFRRTIHPLGLVQKSLKTKHKKVARRREEMLLTFQRDGEWLLLEAFANGEVSAVELEKAKQKQKLAELKERLSAPNVSFEEALKTTRTMKKADDNVADSTWADYESKLRAFQEFAINRPDLAEADEEARDDAGSEGAREPVNPYADVRNLENPYADEEEEDVTVDELLSEELVRAFKRYRKEDQGRANQTLNNDMNAIAALAECAIEQGWIDEAPTLKRYSPPERTRHLTPQEIERYLNALRPQYRTFMRLLLTTGMRLGEALGLKVYQLNLSEAPSTVEVETNKTDAGPRSIPLTREMAERLRDHVDEHALEPGDPLFDLGRRTVQREHNTACTNAKIPDYTVHDHRHTAAVHLAKAGTPMHLIRDILGHRHLKSTERYAKYSPTDLELEPYVSRLGQRLGLDASGPVSDSASNDEE